MGSLLNFQLPGNCTVSLQGNCSDDEDIHQVQEVAKELSTLKTLPVDVANSSQKKAEYFSEGLAKNDLSCHGSVVIDNIKIYDKLTHGELIDLINLLSNCKKILYHPSSLQTKDGGMQKRKLLSLLGMLNWGVKDYTLQARLLKSMEDRLNTKLFVKELKGNCTV